MEKKGIPKEILEELNIHYRDKKSKEFEVKVVIEHHQAKIPIPKKIRLDLGLKPDKETYCKIVYDNKTKQMNCIFKHGKEKTKTKSN